MKGFKYVIFSISILLVLLILIVRPAEAIIGRHDVDEAAYLQSEDAFPAVFDFFENGGAGTLIAPQWAVTAAHVGRDIPEDGSHAITISGQPYPIEKVVPHPDWSQAHINDIALVKFAEPVEGVEPIALYRQEDEAGQVATLVGRGDFGTGLTGVTTMDSQLRAATNLVEKIESGSIWFHFDEPDSPNTTPLEGVSGPGDSGSPAFLMVDGVPKIVGVSSFSIGLGSDPPGPGHYGIWDTYTNISSFQDWIDDTIANEPGNSFDHAEPETDVAGEESAESPTDISDEISVTPNLNSEETVSESRQDSAGINFYIVVGSAVIILALLGIIVALTVRLKRLSQRP